MRIQSFFLLSTSSLAFSFSYPPQVAFSIHSSWKVKLQHPSSPSCSTSSHTTTNLITFRFSNKSDDNGLMKRPFMDQLATWLFNLETNRVKESSKIDEKGRFGEPMEWSEQDSFANKLSIFMAEKGYFFKQMVANIIAKEYDQDATRTFIEDFCQSKPVVMFSFTTCPFCRRAKDLLEDKGIDYAVLELDELEDNRGNEIRAMLGVMTKRTSVPAIFINGEAIGGMNDGMPGLKALNDSGELDRWVHRGAASS